MRLYNYKSGPRADLNLRERMTNLSSLKVKRLSSQAFLSVQREDSSLLPDRRREESCVKQEEKYKFEISIN